jgi:anti-anti-sigma factor
MSTPAVELLVVDGRPTIRGDCDLAAAAAIEAFLDSFDHAPVDVDLSGVTFLDSSGLRALLNARRRNAGLRVVDPSESVTRVLDITNTRGYLVDGSDPAQ